MKTSSMVSAVATAAAGLLGAGAVHAGGADFMLEIKYKYWIDIFAILLILILACCWWRKK